MFTWPGDRVIDWCFYSTGWEDWVYKSCWTVGWGIFILLWDKLRYVCS